MGEGRFRTVRHHGWRTDDRARGLGQDFEKNFLDSPSPRLRLGQQVERRCSRGGETSCIVHLEGLRFFKHFPDHVVLRRKNRHGSDEPKGPGR